MSATFGKLDQQTLELTDGLNILQAPNESGKSTWCAFLLAMLYGINSRERDRTGFIAEKNRYAPWSGAAMAGRMDCRVGGDEVTLLRTTRRQTAPLGEFQAVYAGTGNAVPGLTGPGCGETILGVSREVYERSAFIRQAGLPVTPDAGLERRIAALITSGEEDTSYTEAAAALKKQLNRRRHNRTGQIPALEAELAETRRQRAELLDAEERRTRSRQECAALEEREHQLAALLALHDRWDAAQERRALETAQAEAAAALETAERMRLRAEETRLPENEAIARLRGAIVNLETVRKSVDKAMAEKDAAMKESVRAAAAASESPFVGRSPDEARRAAESVPPIRKKAWGFAVLLAALGAGVLLLPGALSGEPYPWWVAALTGGAGLLAGILAVLGRERADRKKRTAYLAGYGAASAEALAALAAEYAELCRRRDAAQSAVVKTAATYDALYASLTSNEQGILLEVRRFAPDAFDIPAADAALRRCAVERRELNSARTAADTARVRCEALARQLPTDTDSNAPEQPPEQSREELETMLAQTRAELSAARSAADHLSGQIAVLGSQTALEAQEERLSSQLETLNAEYDAIALALETLDAANTELQNRFAPELGRQAAALFSRLTDGAYEDVALDRSFHLAAAPAGDPIRRDAQLLSAGAAGQLYLAVRLAVCRLVLPGADPAPLVLDDALADFDDARCRAALRLLKEEARTRQILLFTCHGREAAFLAEDPEVSVQRLTNSASGV